MAQLVFVHGVATRKSGLYEAQTKGRDELFRKGAFSGKLEIYNPFWGDLGASFAWGELSLPRSGDKVASFNLLTLPPQGGGEGPILAQAADVDFGAAIDALYVILIEQAHDDGRKLEDDEYKEFLAAAQYAEANPKPAWVRPELGDDEFVDRLRQAIAAGRPASYGLVDKLKQAASSLVDRGRNLVSGELVRLFRDELNPRVANFVGDVFLYLREGERRAAIRARVADALTQAHARAKAGNGPLIVLGHSMGGVILYDMLTDPAGAGLSANFKADVLMTVGSQPGFFEELKLFAASDLQVGSDKPRKLAAKPAADHWWNVYDPVDILSFRCAPIFDGAEDFVFSSVTGLIDAHTSYFTRPRFHARLKERLAAL